MKGSSHLVTAATGLLALLAAATVTVASATPTRTGGCARVDVMKTVFPNAGTVGFKTRWKIHRARRRGPTWPGWCGSWRTTYADSPALRPYHGRAFAEVEVSLYKTRREALVALREPAFGPIRNLPNGVRMRALVWRSNVNGKASHEVGGVASVVGNVFISSTGQGRPTARERGEQAVRAQIRIHRHIQAAVLRLARGQQRPANGAWIAYSTAPAGDLSGSDVLMVRAGGRPKLVAGRGHGEIANLCPAFAPNGKMLAFGRKAPRGSTIVVVRVTRDGSTRTPRAALKVPGRSVRCPKWSSDSSRLAYRRRNGTVIVRGLDGSPRHWAHGDPTIHDFDRSRPELLSPTSKLMASLSDFEIVVSRPDLSERRIIKDDPPSYAIAGWSPDGRKLLVMRDVGGGFAMRAVSVEAPFASTFVAEARVNGARSWPRFGDVSWQPDPFGSVSLRGRTPHRPLASSASPHPYTEATMQHSSRG